MRENNEDAFLLQPGLIAVADGMGGMNAGEVASALALDVLDSLAESGRPQQLRSWIEQANREVFERARADAEAAGMGTTLVAVVPEGQGLRLAHVGDSRAYLFRDRVLHQLTEDHTKVQQLLNAGEIGAEEAVDHPQRHVVTRAIGVRESVEVDERVIRLQEGDRLLLCTDGLSGMISAEQILQILQDVKDPEEASLRLVDAANEAGGGDNVTVIVLDVTHAAPPGARTPRRLWPIVAVIGVASLLAGAVSLLLTAPGEPGGRGQPSPTPSVGGVQSPVVPPDEADTADLAGPFRRLLADYARPILRALPEGWQPNDPFPGLAYATGGSAATDVREQCDSWSDGIKEPPDTLLPELGTVPSDLERVAELCRSLSGAPSKASPSGEDLQELRSRFRDVYRKLARLGRQHGVRLPEPETPGGDAQPDKEGAPIDEGSEQGTEAPEVGVG